MKDLTTFLREGDPAAAPEEGEGLSTMHAAAIRSEILKATRHPGVLRTPWQQPLAVAAVVALTVAAGVAMGRKLAPPEATAADPSLASPAGGRRQFQFSTPGGTRIIWVFDPEFHVKETVP